MVEGVICIVDMVLSQMQIARRSCVKVLVALGAKYKLTATLNRDADDLTLNTYFRKLARLAHPDKGGSEIDMKTLHAARDAWNAQQKGNRSRGRPKQTAADNAEKAAPGGELAVDPTPSVSGSKRVYRVNSEGVMLTYMSIADHAQWHRIVSFIRQHLRPWRVKYWCATLEKCPTSDRLHIHLYLQFLTTVDRALTGFVIEGIKPNASTMDYCGEGLCRKRLQESINRGFFYVWADKIDTEREPSGAPCVQGNHMPCWTNAVSKFCAIHTKYVCTTLSNNVDMTLLAHAILDV